MIDTHCHLQDPKFDDDRDGVVARARDAGIETMITIGEDLADSRRAVAIAHRYGLTAAVGIHPHEAKNAPHDVAGGLRTLLGDPRVVAIGETGLDYYYDHSPRDVQAQLLRSQLQAARAAKLPVIFHQRDAFADFTAILREEWSAQMHGVVHCFTGTAEQAHTYRDEFGLLLGIGGVVTFPSSGPLRAAVQSVGISSVVLETDCPYLAPVPRRGKRNEPAFIAYTAAMLGELLAMPLADVIASTDANAEQLFGARLRSNFTPALGTVEPPPIESRSDPARL